MTSFMSKKKKYKFQVEICLEELLEVPFVSAVLFAKLRLLDGGNFSDFSSRQEVRDHKVMWDAKFSFPCKMMANASTGVMEKCILRISIRKECKGGRSFTKLGFVDLNLAEYAGAGLIPKKALLEGYDARHRQDNSLIKFRIQLNMISGDILFKAPSPTSKQLPIDDSVNDQRSDEFSSGSLAGSINSGSSGFGSLSKNPKRTPLPTELVIGQTLSENQQTSTSFDGPVTELTVPSVDQPLADTVAGPHLLQEHGHSRNSSNTSQMSKASGYSSISHSRQSSSGDSGQGHIRNAMQHDSLRRPVTNKFHRTYTFPKHRLNIPTTIMSDSPDLTISDGYHTPLLSPGSAPLINGDKFFTPQSEFSANQSGDSDVFKTPDGCFVNVFDKNFNALQKSASSSKVERINPELNGVDIRSKINKFEKRHFKRATDGVTRSKSDFIIPKLSPDPPRSERTFSNILSLFTPRMSRKEIGSQSTPVRNTDPGLVPPLSHPLSRDDNRAASMGNLKLGHEGHTLGSRLHLKMLLEEATNSPPCESPPEDNKENDETRRRSSTTLLTQNPSSGSIQTNSDNGSLDRAKSAYDRRKKQNGLEEPPGSVSGRLENTRFNTEDLIDDLLKHTNLTPPDDSAETSGLQLYIDKWGTASLGTHEVKSQISTGLNTFKQVVMDDR